MSHHRTPSAFAKLMSAAVALMLVSSVGACSASVTGPESNLAAARALWARLAPAAYTVTMYRSCECLPEMSGPIVVAVDNGIVQSRHYVISGMAVPPHYGEWFPSVEGLFGLIEAELRDGRQPQEALYDPVLGYPTRFFLLGPGTEGQGYILSEFQPE